MRGLRWALGKLGAALLVVWIVATLVFFALRVSGDPLEAILGGPGSQASPDAVAAARAEYGLDQPLLVQYLVQLMRIATLQLGDSFARKQPVAELIGEQLAPTLLLATLALILAWLLAITGATIAVHGRGRLGRAISRVLRGIEVVATVTPQFWLGAVLILLFVVGLGLLPATSAGSDPAGLVLPVVTLAVPIAGFLGQVMQAELDDADRAAFATTARSRGASEAWVLWRHTLRHASIPAVALSGWAYGSLLSGAVVVESLFARPGLGRLLLDAANARDVPLVIGAVVAVAVIYVSIVILSDVVELLLDPRLAEPRSSATAAELTVGG